VENFRRVFELKQGMKVNLKFQFILTFILFDFSMTKNESIHKFSLRATENEKHRFDFLVGEV
jgi:hypothetical protein